MQTARRTFILATALFLATALSACYPATPTQEALTYFPPSARTKAACIIKRESGGNPDAVSSTGDYGLFQINAAAHAQNFQNLYHVSFYGNIRKVSYNARYARYLYGVAGWTPWNNGRYPC